MANLITPPSRVDPNSPLISETQHMGFLTFQLGGIVEVRIKIRISYFDTIINY